MRGMRFEETRPGRDVCHQCFVWATCGYAFCEIWARSNLAPKHRHCLKSLNVGGFWGCNWKLYPLDYRPWMRPDNRHLVGAS